MTAPAFPLSREDMRLIAEIGFIGTHTNQIPAARALFESLHVLRPDSTLPWIGLAMAHLALDRPAEAVRVLRDEALKRHPDDAELMAFLGMALHGAGENAEARKVLAAVIDKGGSGDEPYLRMVGQLLLTTGGAKPSPASLMPRWTDSKPAPEGHSPAVAGKSGSR